MAACTFVYISARSSASIPSLMKPLKWDWYFSGSSSFRSCTLPRKQSNLRARYAIRTSNRSKADTPTEKKTIAEKAGRINVYRSNGWRYYVKDRTQSSTSKTMCKSIGQSYPPSCSRRCGRPECTCDEFQRSKTYPPCWSQGTSSRCEEHPSLHQGHPDNHSDVRKRTIFIVQMEMLAQVARHLSHSVKVPCDTDIFHP